MAREVTDADGIAWSCIQAFAGLENDPRKAEAARVGDSDRYRVICTPSGGAQSVQLELPPNWEAMPDEDLVQAIRSRLGEA